MNLTPMRFRNFTWPHNPEIYEILFKRTVAAHKVPDGRAALQDLGLTYRVMRGEGTFTGPGAYDSLRALAKTFYQTGAGMLVHPVWQAANAYFVALELREEPLPEYVRYSFEFWEEPGGGAGMTELKRAASTPAGKAPASSAAYVTVCRGDTLWGISRRAGVTLSEVLRLNPQIKNPNLIYAGSRVRIR